MADAQLVGQVRLTPAQRTQTLREVARQVDRITNRIVALASLKAPVDTGNMRRSIGQEPIRVFATRVESGVEVTANYAAAVENGSGPRVIRPRRKKALKFEIGGRTVFAKSVNHPGTRARPFLRPAAEQAAREHGGTFTT